MIFFIDSVQDYWWLKSLLNLLAEIKREKRSTCVRIYKPSSRRNIQWYMLQTIDTKSVYILMFWTIVFGKNNEIVFGKIERKNNDFTDTQKTP